MVPIDHGALKFCQLGRTDAYQCLRHGHAAGDAVLAVFGRRLAEAVRPADTVGRLGGDEFIVVCENIDADDVLALAHSLGRRCAPRRAGCRRRAPLLDQHRDRAQRR